MEVSAMETKAFWKGEVGVTGQVRDGGMIYKVKLEVRTALSTAALVPVSREILTRGCVLTRRRFSITIWPELKKARTRL